MGAYEPGALPNGVRKIYIFVMNTKLTIRLIGYSLIAIWAIWLIGRTDDLESGDSITAIDRNASSKMEIGVDQVDATGDVTAAITTEGLPPLVEEAHAKSVRIYINRMISTDQGIDQLMNRARKTPENPKWSMPIKAAINEVISTTEREQFESGELYVECGGMLCFIHGDFDINTTVMQLPMALRTVSNNHGTRFAAAEIRKSKKYGWVFFVAAPNFEQPPGF